MQLQAMSRAAATIILSAVLAPALLSAQAPPPGSRVLCDPADPGNRCPGEQCLCVDDVLEVVFRATGTNVLDVNPAERGLRLEASVVLDTRSTEVQGWAFGVDHDDVYLTIREATIQGTDVEGLEGRGFFAVEFANLQTCEDDPDLRCRNPRPGTGLISAFVLQFGPPHNAVDPGRNSLLRMDYVVEQPPAPAGTRLALVDYLGVKNSPPAEINLTIDGRARRPGVFLDGLLLPLAAESGGFNRGDADGNGRLNVADAIVILQASLAGVEPPIDCEIALDANDDGRISVLDALPILVYIFQRGPRLAPPFGSCGTDPTIGGLLVCRESNCR